MVAGAGRAASGAAMAVAPAVAVRTGLHCCSSGREMGGGCGSWELRRAWRQRRRPRRVRVEVPAAQTDARNPDAQDHEVGGRATAEPQAADETAAL